MMTAADERQRSVVDDEARGERDPAGQRPMSVADIRTAYDEHADQMRRFEWVDRLFTGRHRRARFSDVSGEVLDVACGTGTNFPHLPETAEVVGVDVSTAMVANARDRLASLDQDGRILQMDAQNLEFPDDSFDAVISALSTCTFPDPVDALHEMERVCKPNGTIRLVEHGRSNVGLIARYQEWRADAHYTTAGCRWTQEPREVVEAAGIPIRDSKTGLFGTLTTFELEPR